MREGIFFKYDLGPEANKEIMEFFQERIERENFFFPNNLKEWKREVCENVADAGFLVESIEDYKEKEYYQSIEELMNLIEMVPLVKNFDREKDRVDYRKTRKEIPQKTRHPDNLALLHFKGKTTLIKN